MDNGSTAASMIFKGYLLLKLTDAIPALMTIFIAQGPSGCIELAVLTIFFVLGLILNVFICILIFSYNLNNLSIKVITCTNMILYFPLIIRLNILILGNNSCVPLYNSSYNAFIVTVDIMNFLNLVVGVLLLYKFYPDLRIFTDRSLQVAIPLPRLPPVVPIDMTKIPIERYVPDPNPEIDKTCSICCENFSENQEINILHCKHKYHIDCIRKWARVKPECPICRRYVIEEKDCVVNISV